MQSSAEDYSRLERELGEALVQAGKIDGRGLDRAFRLRANAPEGLIELLPRLGLISERDLAEAIAQYLGLPLVTQRDYPEFPVLEDKISARYLRDAHVLPLSVDADGVSLAMADPLNRFAIDAVRLITKQSVKPCVAVPAELEAAIDRLHGKDQAAAAQLVEVTGGAEDDSLDADRLKDLASEAPVIRLVNHLIFRAIEQRASDIHVEPSEDRLRVRYRIDGVLREVDSPPVRLRAAIVSRIKILANIDIAERRIPQDGRFLMRYKGQRLDLRVSTLPTHFGEKVVIRLLDPRSTLMAFDQLGLSTRDATELVRILGLPQGMLLVTGPTGAGKSTTLYSALNLLRSPDSNIITVEDPVEYIMDGINQVQIRPKSGLTFSSVLPSLLRQDPDVIMIGEIRDVDTAEIAMKASQTGQFVLSTLHTNDSISAISRLVNLGVPAYLIASSLTAIIAQRLVRKLCSCRREVRNPATQKHIMAAMGLRTDESFLQYEPVGCSACEQTGFKGRVGIYELLSVDGLIRDAVFAGSRSEEICDIARRSGFRTLQEDALDKVKKGLTTLQEIRREVPAGNAKTNRCASCEREVSPTSRYCSYCGTMQNTRPMFDDKQANGWTTIPQL